MGARFVSRGVAFALLVAAGLFAMPAQAQLSDSYRFLQAVRSHDGAKVTEYLDKPGTIINTRDYSTGESALHIVVQRRDPQWLAFLLAKGADPDSRDNKGNTPLALAAQLGWMEGAAQLIARNANVNTTNDRGETPLILAVQRRDLPTVKLLLQYGADPKIADHIAGMSARDYAERETRMPALLKAIEETKAVKPAGAVAGPRL